MRQRHDLTEMFSTFLQFEAERAKDWVTDLRLRRNVQAYLKTTSLQDTSLKDTSLKTTSLKTDSDDSLSDFSLANYWHHRWRQELQPSSPTALTALGHLSAYLQETCYWSAYHLTRQTQGLLHHQLSDCFQIAIAEVPKVLQGRDPHHPGTLKTYAGHAFGNIIRDFLRQRREYDLCSDWGLLLKLSRKRLKEALEASGMNQETLDQRILAWSCFETLYLPTKTPGLRKLAAPDRQTWSAIATLYNRQRHQLATPGQDGSPELLERWLEQCVKATRAYLYPAVSSLNRPKSEDNTSEWQDQLVDEQSTDLLHEWITQEEIADRQTQQQQLQSQLMNAIATLEPNLQQLLTLYYQRQLTQQQIAQELGIPQYTVSRKLSKAREKLLLSLTQWMQASLHITPTSDVLKEISALLDEWLAAVLSAPVPIP